ncbi:hypothetical protein LCGC14_2646950 [marine sediment metagenome]|uniref:Uncharacterized protein n=1 Tax=marine sediment metagenome TaxID=412755 RepID=A0A0F8ZVZ3_9ZZZZ
MDNEYNIKVERFNQRFKNYESMGKKLLFDDIEVLRPNALMISFVFLYIVILFIFIYPKSLGVLLILLIILCFLIILLYISIITDIIIPDKLKEIYENAYHIHGYIITKSSASVEIIEEVFFKPEEIDDFLASLMSGVVLEKRICFKCQKVMHFVHFYRNNLSEIPMLQLEKIWKTPHIQLYCCSCYESKLLFKKWRKKTQERFTKFKTKYLKGSE